MDGFKSEKVHPVNETITVPPVTVRIAMYIPLGAPDTTYASHLTPFWRLCSLCHQTDSIAAF